MSTTHPECSLEEFQNFFRAKAFDVIGNGTFRKHLAKCREAGDQWAVDMSAHVQTIYGQIRDISQTVASMPQTSNQLHEICKDVMMGAQPPTRLHAGCTVCCITQRQCVRCLDLSRNHKHHSNLFVDARFCFFFMLLWYCNKLEYIIRSFTRTWLDSRDEQETFESQCLAIEKELHLVIVSMHKLFVVATHHIKNTLKKYHDNYKLTVFA
jgi:hypothetical protein